MLGLAQMIDGEKDPRNLMIVFQLIPHLVSTIDIQQYSEVRICAFSIWSPKLHSHAYKYNTNQFYCCVLLQDLFEVIFCYFPITFRQRIEDPLDIPPEKSKDRLFGKLLK